MENELFGFFRVFRVFRGCPLQLTHRALIASPKSAKAVNRWPTSSASFNTRPASSTHAWASIFSPSLRTPIFKLDRNTSPAEQDPKDDRTAQAIPVADSVACGNFHAVLHSLHGRNIQLGPRRRGGCRPESRVISDMQGRNPAHRNITETRRNKIADWSNRDRSRPLNWKKRPNLVASDFQEVMCE